MKYVLKPSLEHIVLVKIVISLWNRNDVRALLVKLSVLPHFSHRNEKWKKIEDTVIEKLSQLLLPQILKEKVLGFIKPVGLEVLKWMRDHHRYLHVNLPAELCWTPHGTIDRKKTAEMLIKCEELGMSTRYKLACIYCLEDDIHKFWNNMPEDLKESFLDYDFQIIAIWTQVMMSRGWSNAHFSYKNEFQYCANVGIKAATEFFLQKLASREREESLLETAKGVEDADVLCFLLAEIDEEQQVEVFKNSPYKVLQCFLQWPLQRFFIEIANCMWDFLPKECYEKLLIEIFDKEDDGYKDWNYQKLFREFWQESSSALKSFITDGFNEKYLMNLLFHYTDKENFRLILKDAPPTAKKKLIYNEKKKFFCQHSIVDNDWDFLEFYIRECLPSKKEMLKFKEEFENHIICTSAGKDLAQNKHKWDQLFRFSDVSICNHEKRSIEEGECSSSKQFRSLQ